MKTVIAGLLAAFFAAGAARACTAIHFAPGTSSATVHGTARSADEDNNADCFTLATGRGQTASLKLHANGPKDDVAFTVLDVVDARADYTFKTDRKTYTINVFRMFAREPNEPFTMEVAVR